VKWALFHVDSYRLHVSQSAVCHMIDGQGKVAFPTRTHHLSGC